MTSCRFSIGGVVVGGKVGGEVGGVVVGASVSLSVVTIVGGWSGTVKVTGQALVLRKPGTTRQGRVAVK